ncbi:MAG: cbb3-type cytochrome c oxidase subunit I [Chloroflexi bacterium]|nr:cbb3-type cytochrome c oxidase subunit I [Chloroflexota bacterium]
MDTIQFTSPQRKLLYSWLLFAITAAGIAGTLAFLVAMTRTPGVRLLPDARAFQVMLIAHVTFALTIWLLTFISSVWAYVAGQSGVIMNRVSSWIGFTVSILGAIIISIPLFTFQGDAVTTDYVPLLDTPLFFIGFVTFLLGIGITAATYLVGAIQKRSLTLAGYGMACAAFATLVAVVTLGIAALRLGIGAAGRSPTDYYQAMFWGMGHSLQYVSVATMVVAWYAVVEVFLGEPRINQKFAKFLFTLFAVFPLASPLPYFLYDPILVPTQKMWGIALDTGLSLPVIILGPLLLLWVWRTRDGALGAWLKRMPWNEPRVMTFAFSAALFVFGLSIHPATRQGTLRTPAHYHSVVVGGVTLAFMGLAYQMISKVNRQTVWQKAMKVQPYLFALGLMGLVGGLLGAGDLGAPRKTYDAFVTGVAWLAPMVLMGAGAFIAAIGGALFVGIVAWSLLRKGGEKVVEPQSALVGATGD